MYIYCSFVTKFIDVLTNGQDPKKVSKQKSVIQRGTKPLPNFVLASVQIRVLMEFITLSKRMVVKRVFLLEHGSFFRGICMHYV